MTTAFAERIAVRKLKVIPELKAHIPPLRPDEYKQLEESILAEGCREAIVVWGNVIVDGHNRYEICSRHSIAFRTVDKDFDDFDSVKSWMEDVQLGRRNLTPENFTYYLGRKYGRQKKADGDRGPAKKLDQNDPAFSSTADAIAAEHGVSAPTVKRAEKFAKAIDTIGEKLGTVAKQKLLSGEIDATRSVIERAAQIAAAVADQGGEIDLDDAVAAARQDDALRAITGKPSNTPQPSNDNSPAAYRTSFTGNNEWYTPARYVELAREVMGRIDVDPASNDFAQQTVKAATFYTAETNGLDKEWRGKVWMNPPYSQPEIVHFIEKAIAEHETGHADEVIILTHNSTDTAWFDMLFKHAAAICFTKGRVRFVSPQGEFAAPAMGQAFTYLGNNPRRFADVFSEVGNVWGPMCQQAA